MLLLLFPQTAPLGLPLNTGAALADCLYRLGFQSASDLNTAPWLTATELQQWSDRAAQNLAVHTGVFLTFDTSVPITPGIAQYALPTGHTYTVMAALGQANRVLRITPAVELWALDSNWQAASCDPVAVPNPSRCSLDAGALGTATLYPVPVSNDTLAQVLQQVPAQTVTLPLPQVLQSYFSDSMVLGARRKESDHRLPEIADHLEQRLKLMDAILIHLYGSGA